MSARTTPASTDTAAARSEISVIICAYTAERWEHLVAAVASVCQQSTPPQEIIVVIDHNEALLRLARQELSAAIVIDNREAQGLSGARNSAIAVARGQLLAFLDDDAVAEHDWLERLAASFADARLLGVGGTIEPRWQGGKPAWFPEEFAWVVGCTYRGLPEDAVPIRNLSGANMAFRREVFATVGGFSNGIGRVGSRPLGCEETELCIRASRNWPERAFLYKPCARVRHHVPPSRATWRYFRARCYAEGLSKALVTQLAGAGAGLSTERRYTQRGVARGVADAALRRDPTGLARAAATVADLSITTVGYLVGVLATRSAPGRGSTIRQQWRPTP